MGNYSGGFLTFSLGSRSFSSSSTWHRNLNCWPCRGAGHARRQNLSGSASPVPCPEAPKNLLSNHQGNPHSTSTATFQQVCNPFIWSGNRGRRGTESHSEVVPQPALICCSSVTLLHKGQLPHFQKFASQSAPISPWCLEISHDESMCTTEIIKCCKSGLSPESRLYAVARSPPPILPPPILPPSSPCVPAHCAPPPACDVTCLHFSCPFVSAVMDKISCFAET